MPHTEPSTRWIRSPLWDGFWMLGGLWLAPLLWWLSADTDDPFASPANNIYLVVTLCFWIGHRLGSSYLAYCTSAYRPLLRAQSVRFVLLPCLVAAAVFAFVLLPDEVVGTERITRLYYLAIADYFLVSYHFAAQHYGILSLYRVRGNEPRSGRTRLADRLFALGVGGVIVIAAQVISGHVTHQMEWLDPVLGAWWDPDPYHAWWQVHGERLAWIGGAVVGGVTLLYAALALRARNVPRMLYLVSVGAMVWMAFRTHPLLFIMAWTAQHWMSATGLASTIAAGEPEPGSSRWYQLWHRVNRRPLAVIGVLVLLSALLLPVMEVEAASEEEPSYGVQFVPALMEVLTRESLVPWLIALGFATGFVHYLLDRAVYRLSDPAVRTAAQGLLEPPG